MRDSIRESIIRRAADGKARIIQQMTVTSFWHPTGTRILAQQFKEMLFSKLPELFKDEAAVLRALWNVPDTRAKLLRGFAETGFGPEQISRSH